MKKTLLTVCLLGAIVVSAFPFRTSCGKVYNVTGTEGMSMTQLGQELSDINFIACMERPSSITIYVH